ncbi:MAG: hypothetical protein NTX65_14875 [Ignavibacteriales bacterium]|nr:hypothetical protein [Ignavibacteriales bacterium]
MSIDPIVRDEFLSTLDELRNFSENKLWKNSEKFQIEILREILRDDILRQSSTSETNYELILNVLGEILERKKNENPIGLLNSLIKNIIHEYSLDSQIFSDYTKFSLEYSTFAFSNTDKPYSLQILKAMDKEISSIRLPEWTSFQLLFEKIESVLVKKPMDKIKLGKMNELLLVFGYKYDEQLNILNYKPGQIIFNQSLHEKFSDQNSTYPHRSVLEVIRMGIVEKSNNGVIVRKPVVIISFNI